jgi:hypothetical protein
MRQQRSRKLQWRQQRTWGRWQQRAGWRLSDGNGHADAYTHSHTYAYAATDADAWAVHPGDLHRRQLTRISLVYA